VSLPIYSDRSLIPPGGSHAVMLAPFWGKNPEDPEDPSSGRFDRYVEVGRTLFELVPLERAKLAVLPCEWRKDLAADAERFMDAAGRLGTRTAVFVGSDEHEHVPHDDAIVFQTSLYRSSRRENEFAQPAWSEDFISAHLGGRLPTRRKRPKPVVGFCGLAPRRRELLLRLQAHSSHTSVRARALRFLRGHDGVETNFVERRRFLGGAVSRGKVNLATMQRVRREYVQNIVDSDYVVCTRGAGNFSYRLYETLSCGRIPVFVDTDCVLPYDFLVDWREHCVWVDEDDLPQIGDKVLEFHERLGEKEFLEVQHDRRRFWEEYISPEGFFSNFHRHFDGRL
jgi:Exostosin family